MVLEPTWLESPDIQDFRTCFKSSVEQLEPIENSNFLNPLKIKKKSAILVTGIIKIKYFLKASNDLSSHSKNLASSSSFLNLVSVFFLSLLPQF